MDLTSLFLKDAPVLLTIWNNPFSLELGVEVKSGVDAKLVLAASSGCMFLITPIRSESLPKVLMTLILLGLGVVGTTMEAFEEVRGLGSCLSMDNTFVEMFSIIFRG